MNTTTSTTPAMAWRQRGYQDATAKRPSRPPADADSATAYRAGYATGKTVLASREENPDG